MQPKLKHEKIAITCSQLEYQKRTSKFLRRVHVTNNFQTGKSRSNCVTIMQKTQDKFYGKYSHVNHAMLT